MFWGKMICKDVILRTEIPVVLKVISKVCENKYYDWKYLWILVRNDLNTSGMKYLYVIDLVCSITENYGVFGIGDISLICVYYDIWFHTGLKRICFKSRRKFILIWRNIYYFKCLKETRVFVWRTVWKDILKLYNL